ncbi:MAG: FAD-dependent oxidoreductase [Chloroflexi bacterium]|nr:FAD-dependent oxidoreductase [Chloroflexota bacterium]
MARLEDLGVVIETDVLVLGGGVAGAMAGLAAREAGGDVSVTVVEKAAVVRSGSAASGLDHMRGIFPDNPGDRPDEGQVDAFVEAFVDHAEGMCDPDLLRIIARETADRMFYLERFGLPVRDQAGRLIRVKGAGLSFPAVLSFEGESFKPVLAGALRQQGVSVVNRTMSTSLLVEDGEVVGATGFDVRNGEFRIFLAKATVLTTGVAARVYLPLAGLRYNTWMCPYTTGDGHAMAYRAGAELAGLEFPVANAVPKDFSIPGWGGFVGVGAHLINALGERFMERYNPKLMEGAPRQDCVFGILNEIRDGRGPCYLDFRHLSADKRELYVRGLLNEKPTALGYLEQRAIDLSKDPMEVEITEPYGYNGGACGALIDEDARTSVVGLFAAGDAVGGVGYCAASTAVVFGWRAGLSAASRARTISKRRTPSTDQVNQEKEVALAPARRTSGIASGEFEDKLQRVMSDYVGLTRSENSLKTALGRLEKLREFLPRITAADAHDLVQANEVRNLLLVGEMMARAALVRTESRWYHRRTDYPARDDQNWLKHVVIRREAGEMKLTTRPVKVKIGTRLDYQG